MAKIKKLGPPCGEEHPLAKANDEMVRSIRKDYEAGYGYVRLGTRYGLSPQAVRNIVKKITWAHVA